jgi:hypothetical protein
MATDVELAEIERARQTADPVVVDLIAELSSAPDRAPTLEDAPPREGAMTFARFLIEIRGREFRRKTREEQRAWRLEQLKSLEASDAEIPLAPRLKVHRFIYELWTDGSPVARERLLEILRRVALTYGPWKAVKRIFKEAEAAGDLEVIALLAARFDTARATGRHQVSSPTLGYLVRRAWRYLRRLGETLPIAYPDAAAAVLANYEDAPTRPTGSYWVYNHILYHQTRTYNRTTFKFSWRSQPDPLKQRAFAEAWRRTPRPLFTLLERARCDAVRAYAISALQADFRTQLRDVEPSWVERLIRVRSTTVDEFVIWILNNVPRFEQAAFRDLGLHEAVLKLLDSRNPNAQAYAAGYARTHARDLPVAELVRLANSDHKDVYSLALELLQSRDARKDVGLEAWGLLLETRHGRKLAMAVIPKHFGPAELTPRWFLERLLSPDRETFRFASVLLTEVHPLKQLGPGLFVELVNQILKDDDDTRWAMQFAFEKLATFDVNTLDAEFLKRAFVADETRTFVAAWLLEGRLKPQTVSIDLFKSLAFHPDRDGDAWFEQLRQESRVWRHRVENLNEQASVQVLSWLADIRKFAPQDLGFDWLLGLVRRSEPRYHDFAVDVLTRAFVPADFAPSQTARTAASPTETVDVDLQGGTFLFTGKLATMTRNEANAKVRDAKGQVANSVTAKLNYLVIGDEGSPLYGAGKKGSKQLKAEQLSEADAGIRIISETAFLQMLTGRQTQASEDQSLAGCERVWQMLVAPGRMDDPLRLFARHYLRLHHPDIGPAETDRPVDPGAEIPRGFLSFDRVRPLFGDSRKLLRDLAIEFGRWEFARWSPPIGHLVELCELTYGDVRGFVAECLLAEEHPDTRRYRINPSVLTSEAVYRFCESREPSTRVLGMRLIEREPRLREPDELFRLTESPDRRVREFVVRSIWSLYRDRAITDDWRPRLPQVPESASEKAKARAAERARELGHGAPPRPPRYPAAAYEMSRFLRRILFEIPPGRPESTATVLPSGGPKLPRLPARKAKLALIETFRDLAVEDREFATLVRPLLVEFLGSRGQSEHAACLVAVTRIDHVLPDLAASTSAGGPVAEGAR